MLGSTTSAPSVPSPARIFPLMARRSSDIAPRFWNMFRASP